MSLHSPGTSMTGLEAGQTRFTLRRVPHVVMSICRSNDGPRRHFLRSRPSPAQHDVLFIVESLAGRTGENKDKRWRWMAFQLARRVQHPALPFMAVVGGFYGDFHFQLANAGWQFPFQIIIKFEPLRKPMLTASLKCEKLSLEFIGACLRWSLEFNLLRRVGKLTRYLESDTFLPTNHLGFLPVIFFCFQEISNKILNIP